MSTFKTKHFVDVSLMIQTFSNSEGIDFAQLNRFVDYLVFNFAADNRLFNEKLFRSGCGNKINQDCIILRVETVLNKLEASVQL